MFQAFLAHLIIFLLLTLSSQISSGFLQAAIDCCLSLSPWWYSADPADPLMQNLLTLTIQLMTLWDDALFSSLFRTLNWLHSEYTLITLWVHSANSTDDTLSTLFLIAQKTLVVSKLCHHRLHVNSEVDSDGKYLISIFWRCMIKHSCVFQINS